MLFDPDRALEVLSADPPACAWPAGGPEADFVRSPAAARVGELAAAEGLFLFHFEHRAHLPVPDGWLPDGADPGLAAAPEWTDGVLPEAKYQSFLHDLMIGSFHPGHRGKWTTHELCHALVGFGWRPEAPPLFHATAARLAELLPVVLYYFVDEVRLRRCPDHDGGGPLFRSWCPRCEAAAGEGPRRARLEDRETLRDAARYLDRELAAIARTRRTGRPYAIRWGSLDLCTDGLAYAAAHQRRLGSPAFAWFADQMLAPDVGWSSDLDALEARVVAVTRALVLGEPLPARIDAAAGRRRWVAQDLVWRLLHAIELADPGLRAEARAVVQVLAASSWEAEAFSRAEADWPLEPSPFALGYPVDGLAPDSQSVGDGLRTACPLTLEGFEDAGVDPVPVFAVGDRALRMPLADRFAAWCADRHSPEVGALARFEAALRHAGSDPLAPVLGQGSGDGKASPWARILDEALDPIALSDGVESGEIAGRLDGERLVLRDGEGQPPVVEGVRLAVSRDGTGQVAVVELDGEDDPGMLAELGLFSYERWPIDHG